MKDLVVRLSALDPDAGAAVRVIAYFDQLTDARAGLATIVRGAAVLAGCPARLADRERGVDIRVGPDGRRGEPGGLPDPSWLSTPVAAGGSAVLWLERLGPAGPVEAMVLERAAAAARAVLDRTRGRAPAQPDEAAVEVLIDQGAPPEARRHAARAVGLPESGLARAVALEGGGARIAPATTADRAQGPWNSDPEGAATGPRAGVGTAVPVLSLPASWAAARTALRLTAEGTDEDPGPRVVHADEVGALVLLADSVGPATPPLPDVLALEQAAAAAPWMLATLYAVATSASLRAAAAALRVHHSTLQDRIVHAERLLGWPVREPPGQFRLHLALVLRRLHRHAAQSGA
jgi:PucR C-terminal helix-turn-helix domain